MINCDGKLEVVAYARLQKSKTTASENKFCSSATRDHRDPTMVNYKRGGNSVENLRYSEDPREEERSFFGDARFWFPHQADWYETVIMTMKHVTTEMKWIDWNYLRRLDAPTKDMVDAVYTCC